MDKLIQKLIHFHHGDGIVLYVLITTATAALLSFLIGLERQLRGEAAGVRTHALLAAGSSMLITLSIWAIRIADGSLDIIHGTFDAGINYDTSRIAAAVTTGIGFLGGGVIVKNQFSVKGLSTASTLWICTAIGLSCGAGFVLEASIFTIVILIILVLFGRVLEFIDEKSPSVTIACDPNYPIMSRVRCMCASNGLELKQIRIISFDQYCIMAKVSFAFRTDEQMIAYFRRQMMLDPNVLALEEAFRRESEEK